MWTLDAFFVLFGLIAVALDYLLGYRTVAYRDGHAGRWLLHIGVLLIGLGTLLFMLGVGKA